MNLWRVAGVVANWLATTFTSGFLGDRGHDQVWRYRAEAPAGALDSTTLPPPSAFQTYFLPMKMSLLSAPICMPRYSLCGQGLQPESGIHRR